MKLLLVLLFLTSVACYVSAWNHPVFDRRSLGRVAAVATMTTASSLLADPTVAAAPPTAIDSSNLALRFQSNLLKQPPISMGSELNGIDNTYFPSILQGTWKVTQTLTNVDAPLGLAFLGGPNGLESIGEKTLTESRQRLDVPVEFQLRFVPTKFGVAEDRLFNTRQRLDAFAGRKVVGSVDYADVGGSNRASVLAMGGSSDDPLQTTLVYFKGPAAEKTFVTGHGSNKKAVTKLLEDGQTESWTGYELQRSIFALTNASTAPPITTDRELLYNFQVPASDSKDSSRRVQGKLRIASYLNPTDKLYFEARNRAVSIQDYTLIMVRIGD